MVTPPQSKINLQVGRSSSGQPIGGGGHRLRIDWTLALDRLAEGGVSLRLDSTPSSRRVVVRDLALTTPGPAPSLLLHSSQIRLLLNYLHSSLFSHNFGWFIRFGIVGYNFTLKSRFRRSLLRLNLGYSRHKFVLVAPRFVRFLTRRKRRVFILSYDFPSLLRIARLIHALRNIVPYKVRGLVLEGGIPYPVKQGKKVKFR